MADEPPVEPAVPLRDDWRAAWETEDNFWEENFSSRPYVIGPDYYDRFRPAYRYGFESARHHAGRKWEEAEPQMIEGWDRYEHRGEHKSTWDEIRSAVRDAWDRVTGTPPAAPSDNHETMSTRPDDTRR